MVSNQTAEEDESHNIALWCKGSTQEFDSCNTGSIPVRVVMGKWRSGLINQWSWVRFLSSLLGESLGTY